MDAQAWAGGGYLNEPQPGSRLSLQEGSWLSEAVEVSSALVGLPEAERRHWLYRCLARSAKWLSQTPPDHAAQPDAATWLQRLLVMSEGHDNLAGRCLALATQVTLPGGKAWRLWGDWNYRRAKGMGSGGEGGVGKAEEEELRLLAGNLASVEASGDPTRAAREGVLSVLVRAVLGEAGQREALSHEALVAVGCGVGVEDEAFLAARVRVGEVRARREKARAGLFHAALRAYCRQLGEEEGPPATTLSALRLIKMLARLDPEVEEGKELEALVEATPLAPWLRVTPQLLAKLASLPDPQASARLLRLAERLTLAAPHELAWSVVVGHEEAVAKAEEVEAESAGQGGGGAGVREGGMGEGAGGTTGGRAAALRGARERFGVLEEALGKAHPKLLGELRAFMGEVLGLSQLWDERWLGLVEERWSGLQGRLKGLAREAASLSRNPTLSEDEKKRIAGQRYAAVLLPVALDVEALAKETVLSPGGPCTPHDRSFSEAFRRQIEEALALLRAAPDTQAAMSPLTLVWPVFQTLRTSLTSAMAQRGLRLKLHEVSKG